MQVYLPVPLVYGLTRDRRSGEAIPVMAGRGAPLTQGTLTLRIDGQFRMLR